MGWSYGEREGTADEYFRRQLFGHYEVLASATVNLSEYYAAIKDRIDGSVTAFVAAIRYTKDGMFGYKDMDESMGPYMYNCPAKVLDLLTDPAPGEDAVAWRAACREELARKQMTRQKNQELLKPGARICLGDNPDTYRVSKEGRTTIITNERSGRRYRLPRGRRDVVAA